MTNEQTITPTLQEAIRARSLIERAVEHAEEDLKSLKQTLNDADIIVLNSFEQSGTDAITVDGFNYKVDTSPILTPATDCSAQVVAWINDNGGSDLTVPSMHWKRRNSFLNQTLINDDGVITIPDELVGLIDVFTDPRLTKRKA